MHILYKCHALATVLCLFTEKVLWTFSHSYELHTALLLFSSASLQPVCHLVSFYTSASVLILNLFCQTIYFRPWKFYFTKCCVSSAVFHSFLFWHKGLNLEPVHTSLIHWNLHKVMQEWLHGEALDCTLVSVFLHGDGLNWHCRQWSIVSDTICAVVLTLALADVTTASPRWALHPACTVWGPVYSHLTSLCTGLTVDECTQYTAILILYNISLVCVWK